MAAKFDQNDDSVVVIVGSGAGGGTLGNELAQKGVKVVVLEAGKRNEFEDFVNDEWESFTQLAWKDMRTTSGNWRVHKDFPNLPAWIVKAVGGTTIHWAGASLRFQEHEFKDATTYGAFPAPICSIGRSRLPSSSPITPRPRTRWGSPAPTTSRACRATTISRSSRPAPTSSATRSATPAAWRSIPSRARRPQLLPADRLLLPGLQVGREMVDALHRDPEGRGDRQPGGPPRIACRADRARRLGQGHRRHLFRRGRQAAAAEGAHRRGRRQFARKPASAAQLRLVEVPRRARQFLGPGRPQLHAPHDRLGLRRVRQAGAHVSRHDHGRHHPRRGAQRSEPRLRRRLRTGDAVARPALHGRLPRSGRLGPRIHHRARRLLRIWPACGSSARTCRRRPTASR